MWGVKIACLLTVIKGHLQNHFIDEKKLHVHNTSLVGGWGRPILKNIISSNWVHLPQIGVELKNIWDHQLDLGKRSINNSPALLFLRSRSGYQPKTITFQTQPKKTRIQPTPKNKKTTTKRGELHLSPVLPSLRCRLNMEKKTWKKNKTCPNHQICLVNIEKPAHMGMIHLRYWDACHGQCWFQGGRTTSCFERSWNRRFFGGQSQQILKKN